MANNGLQILRRGKRVLPHITRLCLISTFLEDGIRMWVQWSEQREYMDISWGCGQILATLFVLINFLGQLGGCAMVLIRKKVPIACGILFFIVVLQTIAYSILWDLQFLFRNLALVGALLLVLAESREDEGRSLFAGLPSVGDNKPKNYLQLAGRILVVFMFATLLRLEISFMQVKLWSRKFIFVLYYSKKDSVIFIGFSKFCCDVIAHNLMWKIKAVTLLESCLKNKLSTYFQTLSVIGGLLMVVSLGPGGVSMDEHKKKW
ncbi:hypothetical protein B566_EDAN009380 [Ephemera danica]|nr:hypothetical protein B566_EDAN009380 [Ephemera danica]